MNVHGEHYRTIWLKHDDPRVVQIIDQRHLPFAFVVEDLATVDEMATAIADMHLRGAGLIGAAAGYGMYLAALAAAAGPAERFAAHVAAAGEQLKATRPTAVNLAWAVERQLAALRATAGDAAAQVAAALATAQAIADEDADFCRRIGEHGLDLIAEISRRKNGAPVNVLTHCNAGWLAFVDYGTATAPIYAAHDRGIPVHVWVDETRPRNQGARLTAWELGQHGVPHTVIADNVGGHLMQHGLVDLVITGTDRTTFTGDVANQDRHLSQGPGRARQRGPVLRGPAVLDLRLGDARRGEGDSHRAARRHRGAHDRGAHGEQVLAVRLTPEESPAANYAFDVTPARLVTGLITERGICAASEEGVLGLYPERRPPV